MTEPMERAAAVQALPADLMFASRIRAAGEAAGASVALHRSPKALLEAVRAGGARLILIDLDARGWDGVRLIRTLKSEPETQALPVVAFVSHVREDAIAAARAARADQVLVRSAFVRLLPGLIAAATNPG